MPNVTRREWGTTSVRGMGILIYARTSHANEGLAHDKSQKIVQDTPGASFLECGLESTLFCAQFMLVALCGCWHDPRYDSQIWCFHATRTRLWRKQKHKNKMSQIGLRISSTCKAMNPKTSAKTGGAHVALASSVIIRGAMSKHCVVM